MMVVVIGIQIGIQIGIDEKGRIFDPDPDSDFELDRQDASN